MSRTCPQCGGEGTLNEQWDAYFCAACDVWLEDKCQPPPSTAEAWYLGCYFHCWDRPDKPSLTENAGE